MLANNITLDAPAMAALNDVDAASSRCDLQAEATKVGVLNEAIARARPLGIDAAFMPLKSKLGYGTSPAASTRFTLTTPRPVISDIASQPTLN